ncbi:hypothetical protein DFH06DRAFT_1123349 [Mycena polygramma]|nr:hypothetical protein DFH06DRAFT_1123349 [Mycena polygramma]
MVLKRDAPDVLGQCSPTQSHQSIHLLIISTSRFGLPASAASDCPRTSGTRLEDAWMKVRLPSRVKIPSRDMIGNASRRAFCVFCEQRKVVHVFLYIDGTFNCYGSNWLFAVHGGELQNKTIAKVVISARTQWIEGCIVFANAKGSQHIIFFPSVEHFALHNIISLVKGGTPTLPQTGAFSKVQIHMASLPVITDSAAQQNLPDVSSKFRETGTTEYVCCIKFKPESLELERNHIFGGSLQSIHLRVELTQFANTLILIQS